MTGQEVLYPHSLLRGWNVENMQNAITEVWQYCKTVWMPSEIPGFQASATKTKSTEFLCFDGYCQCHFSTTNVALYIKPIFQFYDLLLVI